MDIIDWDAAAECLKILSHPHRLQAISLLLEREYSVGEIAEMCGILQNVASEHLTLMKHKGFITSHRVGKQVFYKIQERALSSIITCIRNRFTTR